MAAVDDLPPLRSVIATFGLEARKSLGQNFLLDLNLTARIARASGPLDGVSVVEVQRGQVGQPKPAAVSRTAPPVTTIAALATTLARASRRTVTSVGLRMRPA